MIRIYFSPFYHSLVGGDWYYSYTMWHAFHMFITGKRCTSPAPLPSGRHFFYYPHNRLPIGYNSASATGSKHDEYIDLFNAAIDAESAELITTTEDIVGIQHGLIKTSKTTFAGFNAPLQSARNRVVIETDLNEFFRPTRQLRNPVPDPTLPETPQLWVDNVSLEQDPSLTPVDYYGLAISYDDGAGNWSYASEPAIVGVVNSAKTLFITDGPGDAGSNLTTLIDNSRNFIADNINPGDEVTNLGIGGTAVTVVSVDSEIQLTTVANGLTYLANNYEIRHSDYLRLMYSIPGAAATAVKLYRCPVEPIEYTDNTGTTIRHWRYNDAWLEVTGGAALPFAQGMHGSEANCAQDFCDNAVWVYSAIATKPWCPFEPLNDAIARMGCEWNFRLQSTGTNPKYGRSMLILNTDNHQFYRIKLLEVSPVFLEGVGHSGDKNAKIEGIVVQWGQFSDCFMDDPDDSGCYVPIALDYTGLP